MTIHGTHQALWEALVDLVTHHSDGACGDAHCPRVQAVVHEQHALVDASASDPMDAVTGMIGWATTVLADTLVTNARTAATDTGRTVAGVVLSAQGIVGTMCAQLVAAQIDHDHEAVDVLTRLACKHPQQGAAVASELVRQIAAALVTRHAQLHSKGARL